MADRSPSKSKAPIAEVEGSIDLVASNDGMIELIHSTNPDVLLRYTPKEIDAFLYGAKHGEFDHLLTRG